MQSNNPQVGPIDLDYLFGIDYDATESIVHKEQEGLPHNPDLFIGLFKEQSQTPYSIIKEILSNLNLKKGDVLMDLGSGFGRFILYGGVLYPENKFIGIELSSARANQSIRGKNNWV